MDEYLARVVLMESLIVCMYACVAVNEEVLAADRKRVVEVLLEVSAMSHLSVDVLRMVAEYAVVYG